MEENRLQDIPQFRTLEENLELRVALQQVDKLKAENLALKTELDEWKDEILQMPGVVEVERPDKEYTIADTGENLVEEEAIKYEEEDEDEDDLFKDWAHDSYENIVDPEFDRGFKMGQDWLIDDIIKYLKSIRNKGKA